MKIVKKEEAQKVINSTTSQLLEYSGKLQDKELDFCINTIQGRYPQKGYATNLACKEICYILEGKGKIHKKGEEIEFCKGDVILIDKEEIYFWEGDCQIIMICNPAWYKEQCRIIDEGEEQ